MTQTGMDMDAPVPAGWNWVKLRDAAEVVNGFGFKPSLQGRSELPYPFIKVSDMNAEGSERIISFAANTVDEPILKQLHARLYPAGTVVFPKVGGALLTNKKRILGVPATFDNNVMGIVPADATSEWIYYWMLTIDLASFANTQALPSIRKSDVEALAFPLPSLEEQKRITAILNEQMAAVEKAKTAAGERLEAARALPGAYLREVFEGEHEDGWSWLTIGDLIELRREIIHPRDNPRGSARFVGLQHIQNNTGVRLGFDSVEKAELTGRKPVFHKGDIVYGYLRPYLNKVWLAEFEGLCSVDQYVYQVNPTKSTPEFIQYFMLSDTYLSRAPIRESPGQLPRIRTEEVASVKIQCPSLEQQQIISREIDDKIAGVKLAEESIQQELEAIKAMPAAILHKAFAGNL